MSGPWIVAFVVLWVLVLVLAVVVLGLLRRVAPLLAQTEEILKSGRLGGDLAVGGLQAGEEVPSFEVVDRDGGRARFGEELSLPGVFLFLENGCPPCEALAGELGERAGSLAGVPLYVFPDKDSGDEEKFVALGETGLRVLKQQDGQASEAFQQKASPQAFAVSKEERVVEAKIANSVGQLEEMARKAGVRVEAEEVTDDHETGARVVGKSEGR